jgi:hypothetical protein
VPVNFAGNGFNIASMVFSIDYNQTWLRFDSCARSIQFDLPDGFQGSCSPDTSDTEGEIDCFVLDPGAAPGLARWRFLNLKLRTDPPVPTEARVGFSENSPPPSFGNTSEAAWRVRPRTGRCFSANHLIDFFDYVPLILHDLVIPTSTPTPTQTPTATTQTLTPSGTVTVTPTPTYHPPVQNISTTAASRTQRLGVADHQLYSGVLR